MSEARDVRLIAQWRDDPTEARMTVDLRVEDLRVASTWDVFGAFDLDGAAPLPFILRRDGRIEFGKSVDPWRTDLRKMEIRVGAIFSVWFNETDYGQYKIVKLAELGVKDRK
ncbi:hypothetical protein OGR47_10170 [Methylocystis sp. MJC1]|jgi:hypothetical protein|uniref:hypothetical protein n=1 Tax=Methylocystis sp. MJC1 TaxID=2654282 RepID=UPI0013EC0579|nr:hypothetical protein [Methylocystis sp. MJC1]KAF2992211.1 hypothetical protein MJC1_00587 [Methylocystis sp. MJC1]MBU6527352.1 hypothetical protein [Methylocystis sp. MJC1]UZX10302.1 hypothetical protein OGR47_10170 [Methylocystis sp. MJC1]